MAFFRGACFRKARVMVFISLFNCAQSSTGINDCGEKLSTRMDQDVFRKHSFRSRVIQSLPITRALECHINCMKNCRCLSYNICNKGKLCELNSEKKENNASLYEQNDECDYHEYEFSKKSPSGDCLDPCCSTSSPCLNGGRCRASCMKNKERFRCEDCPDGYSGERCEILPRSCASYAKSSNKTAGLRTIMAADNTKIAVFCHFTSKFVMSLVLSVTRDNFFAFYRYNSLHEDSPRSEDVQNWNDYRLSLATMASIRDAGSTHWIYTCAYPARGLSEVDYLRSKFSEIDILTFIYDNEKVCKQKLEYVNIRGKSCENCDNVWISQGQKIFHMLTCNEYCGGVRDFPKLACPDGTCVGYFGEYNCRNLQFTCSTDPTATTQ